MSYGNLYLDLLCKLITMRKILIYPITLISFISFALLTSCGNGKDEQSDKAIAAAAAKDTNKVDELTQFKYDKLISNVPIPFDILKAHADVPLAYNADAVNPASNLNYYSSSTSKALNLGIYGGDMAYSITYEKFEEMGKYLKCVKKLADDLGIPLAFDQKALGTYKKYGTNKDSLEKIIFSSYSEVDKTLKSNERIGLASLVVTGGWLEGLYATLTTLGPAPKSDKTKGIYKKIWEQKNHLNMIIELLSQFKDDAIFSSVVTDLSGIKSVYENLAVKSEINESELATLTQKVGEMRAKVISH